MSQVAERIGKIGIELQRALQLLFRAVQVAAARQRGAQQVVRLAEVRIERDRLFECGDGRGVVLRSGLGDAELIPEQRIAGRDLQRVTQCGDGTRLCCPACVSASARFSSATGESGLRLTPSSNAAIALAGLRAASHAWPSSM